MKSKPLSRFVVRPCWRFSGVFTVSMACSHAALVSYQSLDSGSGVTLNNGAAITSGGQGKFGEAVSLDGVNDFASVSTTGILSGGGRRTVSAWVRQDTGVTGIRTVVGFGNQTAAAGSKWDLDIDNANGSIEVGIGSGRRDGSGLTGLTGGWMLVVSTLEVANGTIGDVRTYLNGSLVTTTATSSTTVNTTLSGTNFVYKIGNFANSSGGQFFKGLIDDVAIWSNEAAFSPDVVKGLFDVGNTVDLSYTAFDFNQLRQIHLAGSGSVVIDGLNWTYATGLSGPAGLAGGPGNYTLVLDAAGGTGLVAVPEPGSVLLGGLGLLALIRRRR